MKNRKLIFAVALMLSIIMMFGTFSAAAAEETQVPPTGTQTEDALPEEGTTEDSYYDGYEDGYYDGYGDGYGNGYNDGFNSGFGYGSDSQPAFPSIFDFITELRWRLEELMDEINDYIIDALMIDFPAPNFDSAYLPAENQAVLGADALALCEEFNAMVEAARYVREKTTVTKTANVDIEVTDIMGGKLTEALINPILKEYLVADSSTEVYYEGDGIWNLQYIELYPEGLVSAKKTENADGTTDYEFVLKEEAAYFGGAEAEYVTVGIVNQGGNEVITEGIYHDLCADTLDIEWFIYDFAPLQITGASINYPGATIKATTDAQGRFISLSVDMPVKGTGEAAAGLIRGNIALEGYRNEGYTFEYAA
ncbi:MAG: hypothetical protein IKK60_01560 [Clostridia bacterium]|nr:hypothetical protein [Clostridia bacterium]